MFIIDKRHNIKLTKGDTASMFVRVKTLDGGDYAIKSTDTITLTVKNVSGQSILTKTADAEHYIVISHSDTSALNVGTYYYDVQLTTTEGNYYTIIPQSYFELTVEVSV